MRTRVLHATAGALIVIGALAVAFLVYCNIVMPGERAAALTVWRDDRVAVRDAGDSIVMTPTGDGGGSAGASGSGGASVGIVFIPGAKVDPYAYLVTFRDVVAAGTTVVITKPTLNLAFFDTRPLATFEAHAPGVTTWAVGGHSLGGVRACQLAASDPSHPRGLLLLGSYCANDVPSSVAALSLSGSRDGLSTPAKVLAARHYLPSTASLVTIEGASHASFGAYGRQPGDLTPTAARPVVDAEITSRVTAWVATLDG